MKIVILGTGNVAIQLGFAFQKAGHHILQVYGRNIIAAVSLAKKMNAGFAINLKEIDKSANIYLVTVSDSSIQKVLQELPLKRQLIAHTSGSVPMSAFGKRFLNQGVFYPLQSISKNIKTNFKSTPICIEAGNEESQKKLMQLAGSISNEVYVINSEKRLFLHLAAVFVNNFTNHLFAIAENILLQNDLPFDLLKPLISQTAAKIKNQNPADMQTGPAARNDKKIIGTHLNMLKKYPYYRNIYRDITESIQKLRK